MPGKSQMAFFAALLDSAGFLNFTLFYSVPKSLKSCERCESWKFQSSGDGKIQTTRAGAISQSDYRTTEMLAEKSEIFITSLPNFMAFH